MGAHRFNNTGNVKRIDRDFGGTDEKICEEYDFPPVGSSAEQQSFEWHIMNRQNFVKEPSGREFAVMATLQRYSKAGWDIPSNWWSKEYIRGKIFKLNFDGSPGAYWNQWGSSNREVIARLGIDELIRLVEVALCQIRQGTYVTLPVRLFVKNEPTKKEKIRLGRQRLIWSFSLIDQILSSIAFDPSNEAEMECYEDIPTKVGLGRTHGVWNRFMTVLCDRKPAHGWLEMDKSGWDWSVPGWLLEWEGEVRWALCANPADVEFKRLFDLQYANFRRVTVVFSDGVEIPQKIDSVVKSGHKLTISANSRMQYLLKKCFEYTSGTGFGGDLAAMGDDTLEEGYEENLVYVKWMRSLGFFIKDEDINQAAKACDLAFCSTKTRIVNGDYVPVLTNWGKTVFNLRHKNFVKRINGVMVDTLPDAVLSLCYDFAFDDHAISVLSRWLFENCKQKWRSAEFCRRLVMGLRNPKRRDSGDKRS